MQFTLAFVSALLAGSASANILKRAQDSCTPGNDCQRQVSAQRFGADGLATRSSDCSSFQKITKYTTLGDGTSFVTPTAVPAYASSCSPAAEYSSACSCFGFTATTTTITVTPTPAPNCPVNGNNCQRAVTGTRTLADGTNQASRLADCKSYFAVTVTDYLYYQTTTSPTATPYYASQCDSKSDYESACSCFGIARTTTTVSPQD